MSVVGGKQNKSNDFNFVIPSRSIFLVSFTIVHSYEEAPVLDDVSRKFSILNFFAQSLMLSR